MRPIDAKQAGDKWSLAHNIDQRSSAKVQRQRIGVTDPVQSLLIELRLLHAETGQATGRDEVGAAASVILVCTPDPDNASYMHVPLHVPPQTRNHVCTNKPAFCYLFLSHATREGSACVFQILPADVNHEENLPIGQHTALRPCGQRPVSIAFI